MTHKHLTYSKVHLINQTVVAWATWVAHHNKDHLRVMVMYHLPIINIMEICLLNSLQHMDTVTVSCLEMCLIFHGTQLPSMDYIGGHPGYPGSGMPPAPGGYQQPHQSQPQSHLAPVSEIDASTDEVWVETKAGDGKSYYYHAKSRETTWTRPEGPNVKVLTQQQVIRKISHLS